MTSAARVLAPAAGAALFALGLGEARRLATGSDADARRAAMSMGPTRAVAGAMLLARPRSLTRLLGGSEATATGPPWLVRMVAVREIVLGMSTLACGHARQDVRPWLLAISLVDAGEALVLVAAVRRKAVATVGGLAFAAADAGSAATGLGLVVRDLREHHETARLHG
jgi:hypothetical protein